MSYERRALLASPTQPAQAAAAELADAADWVDPAEADVIIALGGDGFMLQTLHGLLDRRRPPVPVCPRAWPGRCRCWPCRLARRAWRRSPPAGPAWRRPT